MPPPTPSAPTTIDGQRFVRVLIGLIVLLLIFSFAGWFWTKANRASRQQIGVPMQNAPELNPRPPADRKP